MKTKQIVLYDEQASACEEYFNRAKKDADKGKPGAVLAQVVRFNSGKHVLVIGYVSHEQMGVVDIIMDKKPQILDITDETG